MKYKISNNIYFEIHFIIQVFSFFLFFYILFMFTFFFYISPHANWKRGLHVVIVFTSTHVLNNKLHPCQCPPSTVHILRHSKSVLFVALAFRSQFELTIFCWINVSINTEPDFAPGFHYSLYWWSCCSCCQITCFHVLISVLWCPLKIYLFCRVHVLSMLFVFIYV